MVYSRCLARIGPLLSVETSTREQPSGGREGLAREWHFVHWAGMTGVRKGPDRVVRASGVLAEVLSV